LKNRHSHLTEALPDLIAQIQVTLACNLACSYCFQDHTDGIIKLATVEHILRQLVASSRRSSPQRPIQINWHGGEPLLAGLDFFQAVVGLQSLFPDRLFDNRIQTNATLMSEELAQFFIDHRFSVGFSLDGPEEIHNQMRRFRGSGAGSFAETMRGIELYRRRLGSGYLPVMAVVTRAGIERAREIFDFFKGLKASVQLNLYDPCLADFPPRSGEREPFPPGPSPEEAGRFLSELFDLWFHEESRQAEFVDLRDELKMILQPEVSRGNPFHKKRCAFGRTIFAPDGRVYSCDMYLNDAGTALGDINKEPLSEILAKKRRLWEEIKRQVRRSARSMGCSSCEWGKRCNGGCLCCLKYNDRLLSARQGGIPDHRWFEAQGSAALQKLSGETCYCAGLRAFRTHVQAAVRRELGHG